MERKPVVKVSFSQDKEQESYYFINRLIEKILIDQLDVNPYIKGHLLKVSSKIIDGE